MYLVGMKQYILLVSLVFWGYTIIIAQPNNDTLPTKYDVALHFNSMCCGAPSNTFLKTFLKQFNKTNKVTVKAYLVGGCGREGEFKILLSYAGLSAKIKTKLKSELNKLVAKQNTSNKAANNSSGNIDLQYNPVADDWQGCRNPLTSWKY